MTMILLKVLMDLPNRPVILIYSHVPIQSVAMDLPQILPSFLPRLSRGRPACRQAGISWVMRTLFSRSLPAYLINRPYPDPGSAGGRISSAVCTLFSRFLTTLGMTTRYSLSFPRRGTQGEDVFGMTHDYSADSCSPCEPRLSSQIFTSTRKRNQNPCNT